MASVLFALAVLYSPAAKATEPRFVELLYRLATERRFSGVVLVRTPQQELLIAAGLANAEFNVPMHETVRLEVYSVSKMVTAAAVLRSGELGRLGLNDSICRHIDPCPSSWRAATIADLLSHRSGIPDYRHEFADAWQGTMQSTFRKIAPELGSQDLAFTPGTSYAYSNWGYVLLALALENAWEERLSEVFRRLVFEPARMAESALAEAPRSSDFDIPYAEESQRAQLREQLRRKAGSVVQPLSASGYDGNPDKLIHSGTDGYTNLGAGGLRSTARDMGRFIESLFDETLLAAESVAIMIKPPTKDSTYALGIRIQDSPAGPAIGHSGGINGFLSYVARYPEHQASVVVLTNFSFVPWRAILTEIEAYLAGLPSPKS